MAASSFETPRCARLLRMRLNDASASCSTDSLAPSSTDSIIKQPAESQRSAAPVLCGAGCAVLFFQPAFVPRGWSAAWRTSQSALGARCASRVETHAPCGAPSAAFLSPGPCFRARTEGLAANRIQAAFAALHPHRVQPLKAVPLSGDGRRAGASRARGYEPRPRAPRQPVWLSPFRPI